MPDAVIVPAQRRVLLVHAHPDDETILNGATMARYAAEGAHVTVVTCTLGEEGEILVPELAGLAAAEADQLGGYRIWELRAALAALGVDDHRFLGGAGHFRDSGMMGDPANTKPRTFWGTPVDAAAAYLVPVIRELRPQVLVAYDENGGYGHPDHIQAHRVAMRALELAADPAYQPETGAWDIPKVYWSGIPRSVMQSAVDALRAAGHELFGTLDSVDEMPYVTPDASITTAIDGRKYLEAKLAGLRAHSTQILVDGQFFALSNFIGREALGAEFYRLVKGRPGPRSGADGLEDDLFAGIDR